MQALIDFLYSNNIVITKTKNSNGFMIYNPSQVTDLVELTALAEDCNWKVISSDDEWDKGTLTRKASIFVGAVKSDLDITDKKAALDYLKSIG